MTKKLTTEVRIAEEKRLVRALVRMLLEDGFDVGYHDGEELAVKPGAGTLAAITAELHSTDEARLIIRSPINTAYRAGVLLVYGNSPWEVFCDWTDYPDLSAKIEELSDACFDRLNR